MSENHTEHQKTKAYSVTLKAKKPGGTRFRTFCFAIEFAKDGKDALFQAKKECENIFGYDVSTVKDVSTEVNKGFYFPF